MVRGSRSEATPVTCVLDWGTLNAAKGVFSWGDGEIGNLCGVQLALRSKCCCVGAFFFFTLSAPWDFFEVEKKGGR